MKKKTRVSIEYVEWLTNERIKINRIPFDEIEWTIYEDILKIDQVILDDFAILGMNNVDFITTKKYEEEIGDTVTISKEQYEQFKDAYVLQEIKAGRGIYEPLPSDDGEFIKKE